MVQELLAKLATELDARKIPYMVIGGQAVLLHGEPRLTKDIDITLGVDTDKSADILTLAADLGFRLLAENSEEFIQSTMVLPVEERTTGIRVDLIFSYSPYERQAITRAKQVTIAGAALRFISAEDLLIHKIVAGRPRDLEDAKGILLKNKNLDEDYILHWLKDFSASLDKDFIACFKTISSETK
ncbi:MAG: nucleotidyltransferase [Elusimicrobiales bacterium]|nr:nucleotidyltransferase [Elusimicrobiales bacterium]